MLMSEQLFCLCFPIYRSFVTLCVASHWKMAFFNRKIIFSLLFELILRWNLVNALYSKRQEAPANRSFGVNFQFYRIEQKLNQKACKRQWILPLSNSKQISICEVVIVDALKLVFLSFWRENKCSCGPYWTKMGFNRIAILILVAFPIQYCSGGVFYVG